MTPSVMVILASAPFAVLAVLGFAGLNKVRDVNGFAESVAAYQILPRSATKPAACLIIGAELLGAGLLAVPVTRTWGAALAFALFSAFLAGMAAVLWRGLRVDCGCFGRGQDIVGPAALVRTGLLLVLTVPAALARDTAFRFVDLFVAALLLLAVFGVSAVVKRITEPRYGPRAGTRLEIAVPAETLSKGADRVLLGFVSPSCGVCREMLPEFRAASARVRLVLVSAAEESTMRAYLAEHGVELPLVTDPNVFEANNIPWPPYAAVITGTGTVLAHGGTSRPEQLRALLDKL